MLIGCLKMLVLALPQIYTRVFNLWNSIDLNTAYVEYSRPCQFSYLPGDTTMYCVGESVDQVTTTLNKALEELALWCKHNSVVPHPKNYEGMTFKRNHFIGPLGSLEINQHLIKWSSSSKLLGVTIDNKLTWTKHISELKRGFVNKLNLNKRSRFLPRNSLLDLYFKVILPSVTYALPIWGCCRNKNEFNSLESIHCRAARVIYNLPRDMHVGAKPPPKCFVSSWVFHIISHYLKVLTLSTPNLADEQETYCQLYLREKCQ